MSQPRSSAAAIYLHHSALDTLLGLVSQNTPQDLAAGTLWDFVDELNLLNPLVFYLLSLDILDEFPANTLAMRHPLF